MRRLIPATIALAVTACAGTPERAWRPTDPSFGRDQAVTQQAFCGSLFSGISELATPEDRISLRNLRDAADRHVTQLSTGPADPNVRAGDREAIKAAFGATVQELASAVVVCHQIVAMGVGKQ